MMNDVLLIKLLAILVALFLVVVLFDIVVSILMKLDKPRRLEDCVRVSLQDITGTPKEVYNDLYHVLFNMNLRAFIAIPLSILLGLGRIPYAITKVLLFSVVLIAFFMLLGIKACYIVFSPFVKGLVKYIIFKG